MLFLCFCGYPPDFRHVEEQTVNEPHLVLVDGSLSALHRILRIRFQRHPNLHQHRNGHGTHAARNRCNQTALLEALYMIQHHHPNRLVIHITTQMIATFVVRIVHGVHTHIDNHAALLDHITLHQVCHTHSRHNDVRLLQMLLQVRRAGVADGHRRIPVQQQHGYGDAHDVAAANHHRILAGYFHVVAVQQFDAALRRAGHKQRLATLHRQFADVHGMEAIHVLLNGNRAENALLVDVLWQRQLYQDAMNVGIRIELDNGLQQFFLRVTCFKIKIPQ